MVAIFTGNGFGLFDSPQGNGATRLGQGRDSFSINAATGNLVLQSFDESLLVRGLGAAALRTYNSRGLVADVGQDGWITGYERRVQFTGTPGGAGTRAALAPGPHNPRFAPSPCTSRTSFGTR